MNFVQPIRDIEKIELIKEFLKAENDRNYMIFLMGIYTGLRISDILNLRVSDVTGIHIIIREQKTRKKKWVRINPELRRELNTFVLGKKSKEYLFKSRQGKNRPITRSMAYRILRKAAIKFKLKDIGTHTLRKTFGYHFYKQTKDIALLQKLFNHSKPEITLRYIGVDQDILDKAMINFKY
ncbi:site-specific integrase [Bacillus sp. UNCCL81]|uniref:site-specific integrase n=1 Tax=Bacillus sp. UNCCL81 TaxID=1502755 RepID=UPI0008F115DF|nr:site-specific integrase [Bacillus sp. UNCCL81]SFC52749.1 Phage integrase family protein [Bacillus sp. UNCCL81]